MPNFIVQTASHQNAQYVGGFIQSPSKHVLLPTELLRETRPESLDKNE